MLSAKKLLAFLVLFCFLYQQGMCAPLPQDNGWPRQFVGTNATLLYYQPQIDTWTNYKQLAGRAAFSITPRTSGKAVVGVVSFTAQTDVNKDDRTVYLHDLQYTSVRFPSLDATAAAEMEKQYRAVAPLNVLPVALDRIMADLNRAKVASAAVAVNNNPPTIFYSSRAAVLLFVQGEPVLSDIPKTGLQFVVNTNWDLFFDKSAKQYYMLANNMWLTTTALKGPWIKAKTLPKDMAKLPPGENWDPVKKFVPPPASSAAVPQVFYSSTPAEMILFNGAPVYRRVEGTTLLYVANTENDVFLDDITHKYFVLLSGRWFGSNSLTGPWTYAGNNLPADFAKIPDTSPKARVLASVPGTIEASDAVMLAQIPTTAVINRAEAEAKVKVSYDGPPQFKAIDQTSLQYATNTQEKIIKDGDLYYLCFQGVWFMSAQPTGPWKTVDSVPKEIYTIPPSSPVYNVTYVTQTNPTVTTVESSTTAGYFGMFVVGMAAGAAIAYGTGFFYPPYVYWGPGYMYPIYHPWPMTYGAGVAYNPWTGGWAAGRVAYGPYAAAGSAAWYNPATGRYGHAASVQGWYGGRTVASAYNPWTGEYGATSQGHNAYAQWGTSVAGRNGQAIQTGHISTANGTIAGYRTSTGQKGAVYHGDNGTVIKGPNGVYAGNDGNAYKRNSNGSWSQYVGGNGSTRNTGMQNQRPATQPGNNGHFGGGSENISPQTRQGLDRSAQSRERGQLQTQRFQNFHRGGGGRFRR